MIRFLCPKCESEMEVDESFAGRPARCPTCGFNFKVPRQGEQTTPLAPASAPRPGSTVLRVGGESVEVMPPLETMAVVSMVFVAAAVILPPLVGLVLAFTFQFPWTVGMTLGAISALLGLITALPAYHNVRRSRGRRRGRSHALICMAAGGGLFIILTAGSIAGFAINVWLRPTCEENLTHIYAALRSHASRNQGNFPNNLEALVASGDLDGKEWLTCAAYHVQVGNPTYVLTPEINVDVKRPDGTPFWPEDTLIVSDGSPYDAHDDGYVRALLLSGEVKTVGIREWLAYQKAQQQRWNDILNEIRNPKDSRPPGGQEANK